MSQTDQDQLIEDLQIRVAYQEDALGELTGQLVQQQKEMEVLQLQIQHLNKKLKQLESGGLDVGMEDNQPPPHY